MDLFPVAVRGSRNYFVWQNCGGVRVQVLEFLQHWVCTGTLYCVLIARTQGADLIQRDRAENCNCSCGEGCGGRAVACDVTESV
jgi:hypothetical protein